MANSVWLKALSLWLAILLLAVLNGSLREKVLIPKFGDFAGLLASGIGLTAGIFLVAWSGAVWYGPLTTRQWWLIGLFWLLLTVGFEFGFGRCVRKKTWSELFESYTFVGGELWPIVLTATFLAPWLTAKIRGIL